MTANAKNLSTLANVLDDGTNGQFLQSTGSGGIVFADVAAGASVYDSAELLPLSGNDAGDMAYVNSTNRFYINNGSGWYSISLVNTNPNITSVQDAAAGTTPFTLTTDGTATVITITANDPEDVPLTYGYSVTAGSLTNGGGTTATVAQSDNVFTVTPTTTEAYAGTFSLTFTASDGINTATSTNSFTLNFITTIANSKYTTLLATAVDTSDNNNITDASSNNHSITVTGDAYAGTFSPYRGGGYSTYFDGSGGDYVKSPTHADFGFSTDDFTIECWYYPVSKAQNYPRIWHFGPYWSNANALAFQDRHNSWSTTFSLVAWSGGEILNSTTTVENGNWYHLTVERSGATITLYVNGVAEDTYNIGTSQFITSSTSYVTLGNVSDGANLNEAQLNGYIRDFRYVKGTAVYDGNFTPTAEPLTEVTNTKLFTSHLPYITDGSNNHSLTLSGDVSTKPFSPYDYNEYDAADHGGSVYFDRASYNSGACITVADHNDFTLGTSDWTVKFWVYHNEIITSANNAYGYFSNYYFNTPGGFGLKWMNQHGNKPVLEYMNSGSYAKKIFDFIPSEKIWYYYELTCSSSTVTFKVNGDTIGTQSMPDLGNPNRTLIVGAASNGSSGVENFLGGYIADFQYVIGGTASESSVPTALMSTDSNSTLHIKGTDASIIDKSQGTNLKLVGNTTGSTTQAKFGGSKSMYFDGTGDYALISKDTANINTLDKDFTIEYWLYDSSPTTWKYVVVKADNTGNTSASELSFGTGQFTAQTDGKLYFSNTLGAYLAYTNSALSANTWYHIAVVRNNNVFTMYLDGVAQTATTTNTGSVTAVNEDLVLGGHQYQVSSLGRLNGYIQDFRFTKGLARYTANFTPPTAELEG